MRRPGVSLYFGSFEMSLQRRAVILVLDGLGARALGPYGNTWYKTPQFNRLAGESLLLEHVLSRQPLEPQTLWRPAVGHSAQVDSDWLLFSDDSALTQEMQGLCHRATWLQPQFSPSPADDWTETELARFFSAATEEMGSLNANQCLVLHSRSLLHCWDAPLEFRRRLGDAEDPSPPETTEPPAMVLNADHDPDERFGWQQAYGAQLEVLDHCLGGLLELISELPRSEQPLLIVTAGQAYPLGEHRIVGAPIELLYDEWIHVPGFVRWPGGTRAATRCLDLIPTSQLWTLARDYVTHPQGESTAFSQQPLPDRRRQWLTFHTPTLAAIRTHAWKLIRGPETCELFVKPDDRWEQNDIANRCSRVVEDLSGLLDLAATSDEPIELPPHLAFGQS